MKKVLLRIGILCAVLILIGAAVCAVKYYNLRNKMNYTPVSLADYVCNAFPKRSDVAISKYVRTVFEVPLGDGLTLRKAEVIRTHERHTAYYVGADSLFGRYYQCIETDYDCAEHAINQRITDTEGKYPEFFLFVLEQSDSTVVFVASRYLMEDTYQGAPALCYGPDAAQLFEQEDALLQFFVLPSLDDLPDDYRLDCEYFFVTKENLQHWTKRIADFPSWIMDD